MSYINSGRDRNSLPAINSARRIKALEEELQAYRVRDAIGAGRSSPVTVLQYDIQCDNHSNGHWRSTKELQDQIKTFREELKKKDSLIQHLSSLESAPKIPRAPDTYKFDSLFTSERSAAESTRAELATFQVKYEKLHVQMREMEHEIESKEIKIRELQSLLETNRNNEKSLAEMISSLREKLAQYESKAVSFETVANRGEVAITTLQRENREANEKIFDLENRLRLQLEAREEIESKAVTEGRRLHDFLSQLSSLLYTEDSLDSSQTSVDLVMRRLTDMVQENAMLKGKIVTLSEHLNENHLESKASRETIMRLVSEVGREQKVSTRYTSDIENLRMERDSAVGLRHDLERQIDILKERLDASQKSAEATRAELELRENRMSSIEREFRESSLNVRSSQKEVVLFREQLANILCSVFTEVEPSEERIKEAIKKIAFDKKELDLRVVDQENKIKEITKQLEEELSVHKAMSQRTKRFEVEAADLAERLRIAEAELASGDVLRDGFKFDKEKYLRGLQRLGEIMKMDRISLDLGLDLTMDAMISRAEQLVKLEMEALADKSTHVYNLQRKVKALKEQLESKDLHIDLLRKKLTGLEERMHGRIETEKYREVESLRVSKLEKLVEKYKSHLKEAKEEIQSLKAHLFGSGELKVRTLEQRKDIEELALQIEELEDVRKRQAQKITELQNLADSNRSEMQEKFYASDNAVQALSSDLRTTKNALDSLKYREKQLVDFRTVVARMLGLDINTLAVPDYEIISRLEKFIQAHNTTAFTTMSLENALSDVHDASAFMPQRTLEVTDPVLVRSRTRSTRKSNRRRARSVSPMRRDTRVY